MATCENICQQREQTGRPLNRNYCNKFRKYCSHSPYLQSYFRSDWRKLANDCVNTATRKHQETDRFAINHKDFENEYTPANGPAYLW
jgi:hypothetical protein